MTTNLIELQNLIEKLGLQHYVVATENGANFNVTAYNPNTTTNEVIEYLKNFKEDIKQRDSGLSALTMEEWTESKDGISKNFSEVLQSLLFYVESYEYLRETMDKVLAERDLFMNASATLMGLVSCDKEK